MAATLIERMDFYAQIAQDGNLRPGTKSVAFVLLYQFYNGKTGRCDPGQCAIAKAAGITTRQVKRAIDELKAAGWFEVRVGGGTISKFGPTTAYAPLFDRVTHMSGGDTYVSGSEGVTRMSGVTRMTPPGGDTYVSQTSNLKPVNIYTGGPKGSAVSSISAKVEEDFLAFWQVFPSRRPHSNPKKPARAKFLAAVKRGVDPAVIIRGAQAYAAYVAAQRTDPQYIKQAATWLNQEGWTENHEPQEARRVAGMC